MRELTGVAIASLEAAARHARRALRAWVLTGRIDAWGDDPPTVSSPFVITGGTITFSPRDERAELPTVSLFRGNVELAAPWSDPLVMTPAEAAELGRSLIAAAQEMQVTA